VQLTANSNAADFKMFAKTLRKTFYGKKLTADVTLEPSISAVKIFADGTKVDLGVLT